MIDPASLRDRLQQALPGAGVEVVVNPSPSAQHTLLVAPARARDVAVFLRDTPDLRLDYCSNVTGVDWPDREVTETVKHTVTADDGTARETEEKVTRTVPGCLEVVYHLYSMALKHGPVILRLRTTNRTDAVTLPSLTPVWRAAEFQEREVYDLYGVHFEGHPDLRRILMWDTFKDHPMRRDYVAPDDFEWEPTPHAEVLERARAHYPAPAGEPEAGP